MRGGGDTRRIATNEASDSGWHNWCRLCASEDKENNMDVYIKGEAGLNADLATAIGKYFWVNVRTNDALPQKICLDCHNLVTSLVSFTERVNKVQAMLCHLQNMGANVNTEQVRDQYGLSAEEDWHHMMKTEQPSEIVNVPSQLLVEEEVVEEDGEMLEEFVTMHDTSETTHPENEITFEFANDEEEEEQQQQQEQHQHQHMQIKHNNSTASSNGGGAKLRKNEINQSQEFHYVDEDEALDQLVSEAIEEKELDDQAHTVEEHVLTTLEDVDDVDDSDLYKELKYNVNEEEYENSENAEETQCTRTTEEEPTPKNCLSGMTQEECNEEGLRLLKRKRGRPRKSEMIKRPKDNSDSDCDASSQDDGDNVRKYECSVCGRQYKNPTSYRKHMLDLHQTEPEIPNFMCEKCPDKTFPTERQLAAHKRSHLPLEEKLDIPCPYCPKKFTKVAVMRQHVNGIHFNEKPYICDVCGRSLKTLAALNEHKLVHTEDCPYECEVCQKRFKNKARLKIHSDIHTETVYECNVCGMSLNTRRTLKMHMLVHSNEKQYKCNFCPSAFKRTKALKNHLILHTGMRPYKCNFCEKSFSNGSNCRSHKRKMHSKELAEEEAAGKKCEPTTVPKLDELRISSNVVPNLRDGVRTGSAVPVQMRRMYHRTARTKRIKDGTDTASDEEMITGDINYDDLDMEGAVKDDGDEEEEDEDEEDEEGETVIYEIIEEI